MSERKEVLWRILVAIVSGIILYVWGWLVGILTLFNWIYALFANKRLKELAEMCETWNTQQYMFFRYLTMGSNERPFPFTNLAKNMNKFKK